MMGLELYREAGYYIFSQLFIILAASAGLLLSLLLPIFLDLFNYRKYR